MVNSILPSSTVILLVLAAPARAEEAPYEPSPTPAAAAAPTVESLQAELQQMQARHDEQIKALSAELSNHEQEAAVESERQALEHERAVRIYGFADIGAMRTIPPHDAEIASKFTQPLTFYLGRLNLYFDSHPAEDFRFLAETRLSLYPNGTSPGVNTSTGQVLYTSTQISDVASPNPSDTVRWGSIILERAVLDWTRYPLFSLRAGLFLTPFGIYNVDHGSPTLITVSLPVYIGQGWIPVRQMGLQLFGSLPVERWELGYAATVSNGHNDGVVDSTDAKSFGGRIFAKRQGALRLLLGASGIYQPDRSLREQFGFDSSGAVTYTRTVDVDRSMVTLGLDQSVDYYGLRIRNELVFFESRYAPGKRPMPLAAMGGYDPNSRQYNWSLVVAYRYSFLEPNLRSECFYQSPKANVGTTWAAGAGLNLYFRPNVILKAAWATIRMAGSATVHTDTFHSFVGILTWAF